MKPVIIFNIRDYLWSFEIHLIVDFLLYTQKINIKPSLFSRANVHSLARLTSLVGKWHSRRHEKVFDRGRTQQLRRPTEKRLPYGCVEWTGRANSWSLTYNYRRNLKQTSACWLVDPPRVYGPNWTLRREVLEFNID